jgi:hypothetical protein
MKARKSVAIALMVLLAHVPVMSAGAPIGKVVPGSGASSLNGIDLKLETTVFSGDTVSTKANSIAFVQFAQGDQVQLGPASKATLREGAGNLVLSMESGMSLIRSGQARDVMVNAAGLVVRPQGPATYEIYLLGKEVVVSSRQGQVEVLGTNRSFTLSSGKAMKFEVAPSAQGPVGVGAHNLAPIVAIVVATAISLAVAIPIAVVVADNRADDALAEALRQLTTAQTALTAQIRASCIAAIRAVSPTAPTTACP